MGRVCGIAVGVGVHVLLAVAVWQLFWFFPRSPAATGSSLIGWLAVDLLLALQFAVPHSVLLNPQVRAWLTKRLVPGPFYGLLFSAATSVSLLLVIAYWQTSPMILRRLSGVSRGALWIAYVAAWVALVYSLNLTGIGWQTGATPWLAWLRGEKPPRRDFQPRGAYRWIRHPVYLSVIAIMWLTPDLTLDHAFLASVWTSYVFIGSAIKDRRLAAAIGAPYRQYMETVPGYPGFPVPARAGRSVAPAPATTLAAKSQ